MKRTILIASFVVFCLFLVLAQNNTKERIAKIPNPKIQMAILEKEWTFLQQAQPQLGIRDDFMFLLDAIDTRFLNPQQIKWVLKLFQTRIITDSKTLTFVNIIGIGREQTMMQVMVL